MSNNPDAQAPFGQTQHLRLSDRGVSITAAGSARSAHRLSVPGLHAGKADAKCEFNVVRRFYAYDRGLLDARVESVDEGHPLWRLEKVSFNAAYGGERMTAYLFLPKGVAPPYQAVVHYPGSGALRERSFEARLNRELSPQYLGVGISFLVQSGRAVLFPIYKSTYERGDGLLSHRPNRTSVYRDHVIQSAKDAARGIDYLETRLDVATRLESDITGSAGAPPWARSSPVENRLQAAVLVVGGFWQQRAGPEAEQINFAPRVKVPVLMLNGRHDFVFPLETSQAPMFMLLGTLPSTSSRCSLTAVTRYRHGRSSPTRCSGSIATWANGQIASNAACATGQCRPAPVSVEGGRAEQGPRTGGM